MQGLDPKGATTALVQRPLVGVGAVSAPLAGAAPGYLDPSPFRMVSVAWTGLPLVPRGLVFRRADFS